MNELFQTYEFYAYRYCVCFFEIITIK